MRNDLQNASSDMAGDLTCCPVIWSFSSYKVQFGCSISWSGRICRTTACKQELDDDAGGRRDTVVEFCRRRRRSGRGKERSTEKLLKFPACSQKFAIAPELRTTQPSHTTNFSYTTAKMGVGRRMKKQGPPEPLDESLVTRKRKDAPPAAVPERSKRSRTDAREKAAAKAPAPKKAPTANGAKTRVNGKPVKPVKPATAKPAKKFAPPPVKDDDDVMSDDAEDVGDVNVTGLDALGSASEDEDDIELDDDDSADSGSDIMDSDEEVQRIGMWSDEEDEDDVEEKLTAANIEGLSRKLDMQKAVEEAEAAAELEEANLQTNIAGERPKILDEVDEEGRPITNLVTQDVQLLRTRLNDTVRVLDDFKNLAEPGRSRTEYRAQMLKDICAYYGYSEFLADKLLNLFPAREAFAFFEANETPRPIVIRTNTLRTHRRELAQSLINRGVQLEPVGKWSKVGLQIFESQVPLGATPEYLAGHYILQAASSFLPVMALAPQENERVLDMTAAPGGKTTHIAALMKNTGCIFANDANKDRAKGLIGNIHRLGVKNSVVCHYSALEFPRVMGGFDRVLLDAPCSGTGVIAKDASVKTVSYPKTSHRALANQIIEQNRGRFHEASSLAETIDFVSYRLRGPSQQDWWLHCLLYLLRHHRGERAGHSICAEQEAKCQACGDWPDIW